MQIAENLANYVRVFMLDLKLNWCGDYISTVKIATVTCLEGVNFKFTQSLIAWLYAHAHAGIGFDS